ncbi:MAG: hypothetical protein P8181_06095 [bacterium]
MKSYSRNLVLAAFTAPVRPVIVTALVTLLAACGRSSRTPGFVPAPEPFELSVHTVRVEEFPDRETDNVTRARFESTTTYFGRFEDSGSTGWIVRNDSIRFQAREPSRSEAFMSADTLYTRAGSSEPAAVPEISGASDSMLACIFSGPSLRVELNENGSMEPVEDYKQDCPGGIYHRLDLSKTLGMFLAAAPPEDSGINTLWEVDRRSPSFSGLGDLPRLRLEYRISEIDDGSRRIQVRSDTTLADLTTLMASGEKAYIIGDHISIRGVLFAKENEVWHEGRIRIEEEIRFVRPALDERVLRKSCAYELRLRRF